MMPSRKKILFRSLLRDTETLVSSQPLDTHDYQMIYRGGVSFDSFENRAYYT